ncbi:acyl carrier protein [Actinophytocola sp.]|uniref:acyl carrier protein n=1 Tax=Actinophytocola sp. TaxID=1872138 RepID=UPI003D6BC641
MTALTLQRLAKLMEECGDRDPAAELELDENIGNVSFEELGFDSLSLFNTCVQIENAYPVKLSLDAVLAAETPDGLLDLVNQDLGRSA